MLRQQDIMFSSYKYKEYRDYLNFKTELLFNFYDMQEMLFT